MRQEIDDLVRRLEQCDDLENDDAALQLGLILEANAGVQLEQGLLHDSLSSIELSERDESAIIERIVTLVKRHEDAGRRHLFWVLSKASPEVLLVPLVKLIHKLASLFGEETAIQAVFALNNCLRDEDKLSASAALLKEYDLTGFWERMNTPSMSCRTNVVPSDLEKIRKAMNWE